MVATALHSVIMVFWKKTTVPFWRAMDRRWNRNAVIIIIIISSYYIITSVKEVVYSSQFVGLPCLSLSCRIVQKVEEKLS